jgi:putative ABC transport system permease protein
VIVQVAILVVRDLVHGYRAWIALLVSVCGMGMVFALSLALLLVGAEATGEAQQAYIAVAGVALAFAVLTGVVSLAQVARVSVALRRRAVALWHVAGILPRQALLMTLAQVVATGLVGALLAMVLAPMAWTPFAAFVRSTDLPEAPGLSASIPAGATLWAVITSMSVGVLGGIPGARTAARQGVLDGLDHARVAGARRGGGARTVIRIVVVALLTAGVAALYWVISTVPALVTDDLGDFLAVYPGMGLLVLTVAAVCGGWCISAMSRVSEWFTPLGRTPLAEYLATRQAASRPDHTRGLVMPVVLSTAVTGIVVAWTDKLGEILGGAGAGGGVRAPGDQLALLIGGAIAIAIIASSSVSYASADVRVRDAALMSAMGTRPGSLYGQAVAEAALYAVMAATLAYAAIGLNEWAMTTALAHGPVPTASLNPLPVEPLLLVAAAFVLNAANLLVLSGHAVSKEPVSVIARSTT